MEIQPVGELWEDVLHQVGDELQRVLDKYLGPGATGTLEEYDEVLAAWRLLPPDRREGERIMGSLAGLVVARHLIARYDLVWADADLVLVDRSCRVVLYPFEAAWKRTAGGTWRLEELAADLEATLDQGLRAAD